MFFNKGIYIFNLLQKEVLFDRVNRIEPILMIPFFTRKPVLPCGPILIWSSFDNDINEQII